MAIAAACSSTPGMRASTEVRCLSWDPAVTPMTTSLSRNAPSGVRPSSTSSAEVLTLASGRRARSIQVVRSLCPPTARRDAPESSASRPRSAPPRAMSAAVNANVGVLMSTAPERPMSTTRFARRMRPSGSSGSPAKPVRNAGRLRLSEEDRPDGRVAVRFAQHPQVLVVVRQHQAPAGPADGRLELAILGRVAGLPEDHVEGHDGGAVAPHPVEDGRVVGAREPAVAPRALVQRRVVHRDDRHPGIGRVAVLHGEARIDGPEVQALQPRGIEQVEAEPDDGCGQRDHGCGQAAAAHLEAACPLASLRQAPARPPPARAPRVTPPPFEDGPREDVVIHLVGGRPSGPMRRPAAGCARARAARSPAPAGPPYPENSGSSVGSARSSCRSTSPGTGGPRPRRPGRRGSSVTSSRCARTIVSAPPRRRSVSSRRRCDPAATSSSHSRFITSCRYAVSTRAGRPRLRRPAVAVDTRPRRTCSSTRPRARSRPRSRPSAASRSLTPTGSRIASRAAPSSRKSRCR